MDDIRGCHKRCGGAAFWIWMGQQDAHILDRCDQAVLDLLSPKSPPARPLEVMIVGSIGETALHQVLAAFAIAPRSRAVGLGTRSI